MPRLRAIGCGVGFRRCGTGTQQSGSSPYSNRGSVDESASRFLHSGDAGSATAGGIAGALAAWDVALSMAGDWDGVVGESWRMVLGVHRSKRVSGVRESVR